MVSRCVGPLSVRVHGGDVRAVDRAVNPDGSVFVREEEQGPPPAPRETRAIHEAIARGDSLQREPPHLFAVAGVHQRDAHGGVRLGVTRPLHHRRRARRQDRGAARSRQRRETRQMDAPHGQSTRLPQATTSPAALRAAAVAVSKFPRAKCFGVDCGGVEDGAVRARGEVTRAVFVVRGVVVKRRGGSRIHPGAYPVEASQTGNTPWPPTAATRASSGFGVRFRASPAAAAAARDDGTAGSRRTGRGSGPEAREKAEPRIAVASASPGSLASAGWVSASDPPYLRAPEGRSHAHMLPSAMPANAASPVGESATERHPTAPSARRTASRVARVLAAAAREAWDRALG